MLAETEFGRGDLAGAHAALDVKELHLRPVHPDLNDLYRNVASGNALVACGRLEEAIQSFEQRRHRRQRCRSRVSGTTCCRCELAEALVLSGHGKAAEARVREAAAEIEGRPLLRPRVKLARVRGLLVSEAKIDAHFAEVLALLERMPHHLEHPASSSAGASGSGAPVARTTQPFTSSTHLRASMLSGAVGWAGRTRGELEAASGTTRPSQPRRTDILTAQELRVARHAAAGMRNRDIAALLYLSPRTVESYLGSAYRKLDVTNRTQLAGVLASDGIRATGPTPDPVSKDP